ncbi:hypothetical protein D9M73_122030 [compost metagenome]
MVAVAAAGRPHHRRIGPGPLQLGRFGHEEGRAGAAFDEWRQEARAQFGRGDMADQIHIALVGRHGVARERPERGEAGRDEHGRGLALGEMAAIGQDMRGQHACRAGVCAHFVHQRIGRRAVMVAARIGFIGNDAVAHKGFDAGGDCLGTLGWHPLIRSCATDRCRPSRARRRASWRTARDRRPSV